MTDERFDMSRPAVVFFKDPRFSEQARTEVSSSVHRKGGSFARVRAARRYADSLIEALRAGGLPDAAITANMRTAGVDDALAEEVRQIVIGRAVAHVRAIQTAAAQADDVLRLLGVQTAGSPLAEFV